MNRLPPNALLAIVLFAAAAAVALRAVGSRRTAGRETAEPSPAGLPDRSVKQMQDVFHELHADGPHALCEVCGN